MKKLITLCLMTTAAAVCLSCAGNKEFLPGEVWLDNNGVAINAHGGGMLYHDGRYYWFGEHKTEGEGGNRANVGVHCYSSKNLYDWRDEGIALAVAPEGSGSPIEKGCILERPKVIYNAQTGKFVMWFHLELKDKGYSAAMSGVAVSDNVTGPYEFLNAGRVNAGKWPLNVSNETRQAAEAVAAGNEAAIPDNDRFLVRDFEGGQMARDMTLFVDDDGKAYHIYASEENQTLQIAELTDDYTAHSGRYVRAFVGRSMEAPAIFKHGGKYYLMMSGCTGWAPNAARSAVADAVMGEWTELGNPCMGDDADKTFHSQSTYMLPVEGSEGTVIYMGDRWKPENAIDGRYIWLPVNIEEGRFTLTWQPNWKL